MCAVVFVILGEGGKKRGRNWSTKWFL